MCGLLCSDEEDNDDHAVKRDEGLGNMSRSIAHNPVMSAPTRRICPIARTAITFSIGKSAFWAHLILASVHEPPLNNKAGVSLFLSDEDIIIIIVVVVVVRNNNKKKEQMPKY